MPLRPVLPGVTLVDLPLVNVWLLHDDQEAFVVDTGSYWDRRALSAAIGTVLDRGIRLTGILQTHGHCDHAGNTAWLRRHHGAKVHAHAAEVPHISELRPYGPAGWRRLSRSGLLFLAGEAVFPTRRCPVDVVLHDGDVISSPIGPLRVVHSPGHTDGHVAYLQEERGWLLSGDAIINVIPWVRRTALSLAVPVFSVSMAQCAESARRLAALDASVLLPGHGWARLENTARDVRDWAERLDP
jgi:glyoxylase-like metal-dependent hydrolase (beta-lactamase superfamily II)